MVRKQSRFIVVFALAGLMALAVMGNAFVGKGHHTSSSLSLVMVTDSNRNGR